MPDMTRISFLLLLLFSTGSPSTVRAAERIDPEIEYLIGYVEHSNARFIRSGTEYSAKEGAEHMRYKLAHSGGRVKNADDFIKGIATKSYFTGKPYMVKFPDGRTVPTGQWMSEALNQYRARDKKR